MSSASAPVSETLPYSLKHLTWDAAHQFNSQNRYGYSGKGRKLSEAMLQCEVCDQWFHLKEVRGCHYAARRARIAYKCP
jgi:hypothetical protein